MESELNAITIPVLLLSGDHDMIKASDINHIASCLPHAINEVIAHCSHFVLGDQYDQATNKIRGFLYATNKSESSTDS